MCFKFSLVPSTFPLKREKLRQNKLGNFGKLYFLNARIDSYKFIKNPFGKLVALVNLIIQESFAKLLSFCLCTFLTGERKIWGNEKKIKAQKPGLDNLPKKLNVLGKKKKKGRRPVARLNYAKLLRYSILHMTNLRNQTLDMLHWVCSRFQFQVGHLIADTARSIEIVPRGRPPFWLMESLFGWWNLEADPLLVDEI